MISLPAGFDGAAFVADLYALGLPVAVLAAGFLAYKLICKVLDHV